MRQKVLAISCDTFVSRLEYCLENVEMRQCMKKIKTFANQERKLQAVVNMEQIRQNRIRLDALIQWVKVVYYAELRCYDQNDSGMLNNNMANTNTVSSKNDQFIQLPIDYNH